MVNLMKMGHLQNIQSFETSIKNGSLQSYDEQGIIVTNQWDLRARRSN